MNSIVPWQPQPNNIYHMDALTLLRHMPDDSVDLIVTDPPYGIGYVSSRKTRHGGGARVTNNTFGADVFDGTWLVDAVRVLKPEGAIYMFTRWDVLHLWKHAIEQAGAQISQRIVWDKAHWGMGDLRYYGSQLEDILFIAMENHSLRLKKRQGNLWNIWKGHVWHDGYHNHPTQKPEALIQRPIRYSSDRGQIILDPFMGSGTTAVAAQRLGRQYIGCDISAEYVEIARRRVQNADPYQQTTLGNGLVQKSLFAEVMNG